MYTLGYRFRPWTDAKAIADGPSILELRPRDGARGRHRPEDPLQPPGRARASGRRAEARWTVEAERTRRPARPSTLTCDFLFICSGYYRYDEGYTPDFAGIERFAGTIVHPQHWPEDLDYAGKRVVVIGSGATAVTLVPALAEQAAHVTMLQRSPTYIVSLPADDPIANACAGCSPTRLAYAIVRWKNVAAAALRLPAQPPPAAALVKRLIRSGRRASAAARLRRRHALHARATTRGTSACAWCPTATCSRRSAPGSASVVTDHDRDASPRPGIKLASGAELEADIIVTATGLNLLAVRRHRS